MTNTARDTAKASFDVLRRDTVVVGSGAAAYNAADWLYDLGRRNFCLIAEGLMMGTSRNTGSDKQTYYKLSIGSDGPDSVQEMAEALFDGGGVDGSVALAEAASSLRGFMKLANLGVDFPTDAFGRFIGYKTDHDERQRGTSAGPLTSRYMTEALERSVMGKHVQVLDHLLAYRIMVESGHVCGLVCLDGAAAAAGVPRVVLIECNQVVWCTGGPAACYRDVVYPASQTGMTGALLEAGVEGANLQEWQYGLASTKFRWNVSGTYQQVLPRYVSVDDEGHEREFLTDYGMTASEALDLVFLKGYQWPFDVSKIEGSSAVDLAVYKESVVCGHHVFLDFRTNPVGLEAGFDSLGAEALRYLSNSEALFGTPIDRLRKMNPLAIKLYLDHGVDLAHEMLEVRVCAQHHNGGARVDANWETAVSGLYVAGEAAGTFGARRPGGSALNATQVGSMRAAQHIAWTTTEREPGDERRRTSAEEVARRELAWLLGHVGERDTAGALRLEIQREMSRVAAHVRDVAGMVALRSRLYQLADDFDQRAGVGTVRQLPTLLKLRDLVTTCCCVLDAMLVSADEFGSHGGALVEGGKAAERETGAPANLRTVSTLESSGPRTRTEVVEPIPVTSGWFESVWAEHRRMREPPARPFGAGAEREDAEEA